MKYLPILFSFLLTCLLLPSEASAQHKNVWSTLGMMKFERQYAESDIGGNAGQGGRFRAMIEAMEGDEIEVRGYIIPLSGKQAQSNFMLSLYPYAACFFCGNAGPETVIEVFTADDRKIPFTEKPVTLKGTFRFLPGDPNSIMYKMEHAVLVAE